MWRKRLSMNPLPKQRKKTTIDFQSDMALYSQDRAISFYLPAKND